MNIPKLSSGSNRKEEATTVGSKTTKSLNEEKENALVGQRISCYGSRQGKSQFVPLGLRRIQSVGRVKQH